MTDKKLSVEESIRQIIVEQLSVDDAKVTPEAHIRDDLGADSLDAVELIMGIEEEFSLEIPDEDAEKLTAFGEVVEYIKSRLAGTTPAISSKPTPPAPNILEG